MSKEGIYFWVLYTFNDLELGWRFVARSVSISGLDGALSPLDAGTK